MAKGGYIGVSFPSVTDNDVLILNGDSLQDDSLKGTQLTTTGVSVSSDQSKYGTTSLYFDGVTSQISFNTGYDPYLLANKNFTIDWWEYRITNGTLLTYNPDASGHASLMFNEAGLYATTSTGTWNIFSREQAFDFSTKLNQWVHYALIRDGNTFTSYVNGVKKWTAQGSGSLYVGGLPTTIAKHADTTNVFFKGYVNGFRISIGIARWTSNFTPPNQPYKSSSTSSVARKLKKGYVSPDGIARAVKKAYMGIGGVARPIWSSGPGEPVFYGKLAKDGDYRLVRSTPAFNSKYAIFNGGDYDHGYTGAAAFSEDLVATSFSYPGIYTTNSCNFQDFAMFYGGTNSNVYDRTYNSVYTYDTSLIAQQRTSLPTITLSNANYQACSAKIGGSVLISTWDGAYNGLDYGPFCVSYDENFIQSSRAAPNPRRDTYCGSQNDNYALFIGGKRNARSSYTWANIAECFNSSFVRSTVPCSTGTAGKVGMRIGDHACRLGGLVSTGGWNYDETNTIDAFDNDLIRSNPTTINEAVQVPYSGIFKGSSFIKGTNMIYVLDSDFVKTVYDYTIPEYEEGYPYDRDSAEFGFQGAFSEQQLNPVGEYLLFQIANSMGTAGGIYAFKFS